MDGQQYNLFKHLIELEDEIKCATEDRDGTLAKIEKNGLTDALTKFLNGKWLPKEEQKLIDDAIELRIKILACRSTDDRRLYLAQHKELMKII